MSERRHGADGGVGTLVLAGKLIRASNARRPSERDDTGLCDCAVNKAGGGGTSNVTVECMVIRRHLRHGSTFLATTGPVGDQRDKRVDGLSPLQPRLLSW